MYTYFFYTLPPHPPFRVSHDLARPHRPPNSQLQLIFMTFRLLVEDCIDGDFSASLPVGRRHQITAGLSGADIGVSDHEAMMRALEFAFGYDQVQASELRALEICVRRAQMVELKYRDRVIKLSPTGAIEDDEHLYMGTGLTRGLQMISGRVAARVVRR